MGFWVPAAQKGPTTQSLVMEISGEGRSKGEGGWREGKAKEQVKQKGSERYWKWQGYWRK